MKNYRFNIENLDCAACAKKIEDKLSSIEEYKNVSVSFATSKLSFKSNKMNITKQELQKIISSVEPETVIIDEKDFKQENIRNDIIRLTFRNFVFWYFNYI